MVRGAGFNATKANLGEILADALFTSWKKGGQPGFCFRFGFSYQVCSYLKVFKNHSGLLADRTEAWLL